MEYRLKSDGTVENMKRTEEYDYWFPLYEQLATLDIEKQEIRHSSEILSNLRNLGWMANFDGFDGYWKRISWTAENCRGKVLEIGCGLGNVTKWIAKNDGVNRIIAVDNQERYIERLRKFSFEKVTPLLIDVNLETDRLKKFAPFDTVVIAELIEHLTRKQEIQLIESIKPYLQERAQFVISTPIGFMQDPDHVRGFSPFHFDIHIRALYGDIIIKSKNQFQQFALVKYRKAGNISLVHRHFLSFIDRILNTRYVLFYPKK